MKRFRIKHKTFLDKKTGLVWKKQAIPYKTWDGARELENDKWRLPTVEELATLVDRNKSGPAVPDEIKEFFESELYWSATTYIFYSDYAWNVSFYEGYVTCENKNVKCHVRLVRR